MNQLESEFSKEKIIKKMNELFIIYSRLNIPQVTIDGVCLHKKTDICEFLESQRLVQCRGKKIN